MATHLCQRVQIMPADDLDSFSLTFLTPRLTCQAILPIRSMFLSSLIRGDKITVYWFQGGEFTDVSQPCSQRQTDQLVLRITVTKVAVGCICFLVEEADGRLMHVSSSRDGVWLPGRAAHQQAHEHQGCARRRGQHTESRSRLSPPASDGAFR